MNCNSIKTNLLIILLLFLIFNEYEYNNLNSGFENNLNKFRFIDSFLNEYECFNFKSLFSIFYGLIYFTILMSSVYNTYCY